MKLLGVTVFVCLAAYAASQTINCFVCKTSVLDSVFGGITGTNKCLKHPNDLNTTTQVISCAQTAKCFTKIRTALTYAFYIERGCWTNFDDKEDADNCDDAESNSCVNAVNTGSCFQCCNTDKCNSGFAQLAGVKNGVSGLHVLSVMALLPVAVAMFF